MNAFKQLSAKQWLFMILALALLIFVVKDQTALPYDGDDYAMSKGGYGGAVMESAMMLDYEESYDSSRSYNAEPTSIEQSESKIIRTANLTLHVEDVRDSVASVEARVSEWGGSVQNSSVNRGDESYTASMTVQVDSEQFEVALSALRDMALYVQYESTSADDVTSTYMDLEARLNNARELEDQYLAILDQAGTMSEVLEVTQALSEVRYQIESYESSLSYYDERVDYSTIYLYLTEDASVSNVAEKWRPAGTVREAVSDWVVWLQNAADTIIYVVIFAWPLVIIALIWLWKRRKK